MAFGGDRGIRNVSLDRGQKLQDGPANGTRGFFAFPIVLQGFLGIAAPIAKGAAARGGGSGTGSAARNSVVTNMLPQRLDRGASFIDTARIVGAFISVIIRGAFAGMVE